MSDDHGRPLAGALARTLYGDIASGDTTAAAALSDAAFIGRMVDVEAALALAVGDAGLVDRGTADATAELIGATSLDGAALVDLAEASVAGGNPAIPLARRLKDAATGAGLGVAAVHRGATSQDIIDTALVLCLRDAGDAILATAGSLTGDLRDLAREHRTTPVIGRTLGQQAVPTTFGVIVAGWLRQTAAAANRLRDVLDALPVQYAGAAGNLASTAPSGLDVHAALAKRLGLAATPLVWHTDRLPLVEVATALAALAGAVRKIAGDVIVFSATEVGELRESAPGGSSAMPHKANPAAAIAADGYARRTPALAATMLDAMDQRMQRATGAWHAEWQTVRDLAAATAGAVNRTRASIDGITVDTAAMRRNLALTDGAVLAEALGRHVPRAEVDRAVADGTLGELTEQARRDHGFSTDPGDHTGHAADIVDAVLDDLNTRKDPS
ncbi:lyase family protein [Corynebacterium sp.]|uniref:lyase family protein n=1 Tax=Corynebacterium sp. TaxID=1720 RepID=UPI0025C4B397|nr:lyase family protein [Corynebacterium sp.]